MSKATKSAPNGKLAKQELPYVKVLRFGGHISTISGHVRIPSKLTDHRRNFQVVGPRLFHKVVELLPLQKRVRRSKAKPITFGSLTGSQLKALNVGDAQTLAQALANRSVPTPIAQEATAKEYDSYSEAEARLRKKALETRIKSTRDIMRSLEYSIRNRQKQLQSLNKQRLALDKQQARLFAEAKGKLAGY